MSKAKTGDKVTVHYTGKLADGTVFDTSDGREPLEFTIGENKLLADFENTVVDMEVGEDKDVEIKAADAYGEYNEEWILEVPKSEFPPEIEPAIGQQLQLQQENGQVAIVMVKEVEEEKVILDANHPLAGKDLSFNIKLVSIG